MSPSSQGSRTLVNQPRVVRQATEYEERLIAAQERLDHLEQLALDRRLDEEFARFQEEFGIEIREVEPTLSGISTPSWFNEEYQDAYSGESS